MTRHVWKSSFAILMGLVLVSAQALCATDKLASGAPQVSEETSQEAGALVRYGPDMLSSLVGDISIPRTTIRSFGELFDPHKTELERLANTHQGLLWEAIAVVIEVLPSLKATDAPEGQLRVPLKTYAKASNLLERCESLASPQLAGDMRKAKALFESMVKESDQENLIIDLKE
jgi:hypothetical protein